MDRIIKFRFWRDNEMQMAHRLNAYDNNNFAGDGEILMQFTGLYDCEGKEVWEGDVIEYTQHHFNTELIKVKRKVVKWNYDRWNIHETNAGESNIKVLGNIYENENLLQ